MCHLAQAVLSGIPEEQKQDRTGKPKMIYKVTVKMEVELARVVSVIQLQHKMSYCISQTLNILRFQPTSPT